MRGYVELVDRIGQGAFLTADAQTGATTLLVTQGEQFAADGCSAVLGGGTYPVTGVESGEYEDDPDVVYLATALAVDVEAGEPVRVTPGTDYTTATVVLAGDGAVLEGVEIRQDLQSKSELQAGAYDGDARPIVDVEVIDDQHVITNVDGRGQDDGSYIDPTTLPDLPTSDGLPPQAAPSIAAFPGSDYVAARLSWVDNPDELHSRVYASTTPEPDLAGPEVGTAANGGVLVVREFGDGTDLPQDVDLWLQAVPFDVDGDGPPSDVVGPVRLAKVTRTQIGEHEIETRHLAADAITADLLVTNRALAEALEVEDLDGVNIRGVNVEAGQFTGGAIAISQGVISEVTETFGSNASPAGWTRSDVYAPATAMRFESGRAVLDPSALPTQGSPVGGVLLRHNDFNAQNVILRFDVYTPSGGQGAFSSTYAPRGGIAVRSTPGDFTFAAGTIGLHFGQGAMWLRDFKVIDLPGDAWSRVEVQLLGSTIRVRRLVLGTDTPASPWVTYGLLLPVATGGLTVFTVIDSSSGTRPVVRLDNIKAQHVPAGFYVDADGKVGVDHLEIFQSVRVPDPVAGGSSFQGANVRYVDTSHTRRALLEATYSFTAYAGTGWRPFASVAVSARSRGFGSSGGHPVVTETGWYAVTAHASFGAGSSNVSHRRAVGISTDPGSGDASTEHIVQMVQQPGAPSGTVTATGVMYLTAGDRLYVHRYTDVANTYGGGSCALRAVLAG